MAKFVDVDGVLTEIARVRETMCTFLGENGLANEAEGLPRVGPAARRIREAIADLVYAYGEMTREDVRLSTPLQGEGSDGS